MGSGRLSGVLVGDLFASAFGREPSDRELASALEVVGAPLTARGVEDLLWMLVMHPEFQLIQ